MWGGDSDAIRDAERDRRLLEASDVPLVSNDPTEIEHATVVPRWVAVVCDLEGNELGELVRDESDAPQPAVFYNGPHGLVWRPASVVVILDENGDHA